MSTAPYPPPGSYGGDASEGSSGMVGQAQEKAQEVAGQAQQQAQEVAGQAKTRLREQLDERSSQAAGQINQQAADLRQVGSSLREQGKGGPAGAADRLADYAEKVGGYLDDRDSDQLLADLEDFGRRQPWAVAAGGLALGFAASRFLKASSGRRYASRGTEHPAQDMSGSSPGQSGMWSGASDGAPARSAAPVSPPPAIQGV